jgi:plasmid stabilization system protein ParE
VRKLVLLDGAVTDLREIARYVGKRERDPGRGAALAKRLTDKCTEMASVKAVIGRPRPEFGHDLHSTTYLSYLIFFRYSDDRLEVVAFIHGARDLHAAFAERAERDDPP